MVGSVVATLVIHVAGLAAVSAILLFRKERAQPGTASFSFVPWGSCRRWDRVQHDVLVDVLGRPGWRWHCLAETLFSVVTDATGLMGRTRYSLTGAWTARYRAGNSGRGVDGCRVLGVGQASWRSGAPAGAHRPYLGNASRSYFHPQFRARPRGVFEHARQLHRRPATTLVIAGAVRPSAADAFQAVVAAGPFLALGGGLVGVVVVTGMNIIFPRMPAFTATFLPVCREATAGVAMEAAASGAFDAAKLVGTVVLLSVLPERASQEARRGCRVGVDGRLQACRGVSSLVDPGQHYVLRGTGNVVV